jgi:hypothetical protein
MKKLILLTSLLLTSCTFGDKNISNIKAFYKNFPEIVEVSISESVAKCPTTNWKETIVIGTSRVTRTVKTECSNVYLVEYLTNKNDYVDWKAYDYRLTDHKINMLIIAGTVILPNGKYMTIAEYFKELNK